MPTGETTQEALSLQEHLNEIEGLVGEAHKTVDRMRPEAPAAGESKEPEAPGAAHVAGRCRRNLRNLNQRLSNIADSVGAL